MIGGKYDAIFGAQVFQVFKAVDAHSVTGEHPREMHHEQPVPCNAQWLQESKYKVRHCKPETFNESERLELFA
jgi:hypothetical protein